MNEPRLATVVHRRIGGMGIAVTILIGVVLVLDVASNWTTWHVYGVTQDYYVAGAGVTDAHMYDADAIASTVSWSFLLATTAAGNVFVAWLWRARLNAELLLQAPHRRGRGWVIGSWLCPIVNLWFPFMIVDDVYRASRPDNPPDLFDLRSVPGSRLLGLWWALWLGGSFLEVISFSQWSNADSVESLHSAAVVETVGTASTVGAGVAIILVVRRISAWQDGRAA
jgi:hypothetical protein